jgi:hypothetical protein
VDASVDERLAYCRNHLLRVNSRDGTFGLMPEGPPAQPVEDIAAQDRGLFRGRARAAKMPKLAEDIVAQDRGLFRGRARAAKMPKLAEDIVAPESGVFLCRGWLPLEQYCGQPFRWVESDAEVIVQPPGGHAQTLTFDLEPGPGVGFKPFVLQVLDGAGALIGETEIRRRSLIRLRLPFPDRKQVFRFRVIGGGLKVAHDHRILNFRVFRCTWEKSRVVSGVSSGDPAVIGVRVETVSIWSRFVGFGPKVWNLLRRAVRFLSVLSHAKEQLRFGLPISPRLVDKLQLHVDASGISMSVGSRVPSLDTSRLGVTEPPTETLASTVGSLHTNGCGDFTLLARDHWLDLRGYPEFDLFSMNIDSILCYAAHYGGAREEILVDPIRIYHIEHATGSGWTPEGQARLFKRIAAKGLSWIDYSEVVGWAAQMQRLGTPMIFNRENWGLADFDLPETVLNP